MAPRKRTFIGVCLLFACAFVLTATAASLYEYTPEELTGPEQPIAFNHQIHAGSGCRRQSRNPVSVLPRPGGARPERDGAAGVDLPGLSPPRQGRPHARLGRKEIAKIHEYVAKGESIPWVRIHHVPDYVQFKHMRHVNAGVACQECHGQVQDMKRVYLVPQMQITKRSLFTPSQKLEMGWCMECHLQRGATDDCAGLPLLEEPGTGRHTMPEIDRRDFLKIVGMTAGAAATVACKEPIHHIIPYLNQPEEVVPGIRDLLQQHVPHLPRVRARCA